MNNLKKLQKLLTSKENIDVRKYILIDENTYTNCLPILIDEVDALNGVEILEIESGEGSKCLAIAEELCSALLESGADNKSILISLGGGVITDLGGFIASVFKRGIRHISIPTTLLAMVDASIGGKTAVNLGEVKNQIGTITEPYFTCFNTDFLETLDKRQILNGAAEMIKIALVADEKLWDEMKLSSLSEEYGYNDRFIERSIELKQQIVKKDFYEKNIRKSLNFGHSLGHAFESLAINRDDMDLLHGEAVAIGMYYALKLSVNKVNFPKTKASEICNYLKQNYNIISLKENIDIILNYLQADKKNFDNSFKFVLLKDVGNPEIDITVTKEDLLEL